MGANHPANLPAPTQSKPPVVYRMPKTVTQQGKPLVCILVYDPNLGVNQTRVYPIGALVCGTEVDADGV